MSNPDVKDDEGAVSLNTFLSDQADEESAPHVEPDSKPAEPAGGDDLFEKPEADEEKDEDEKDTPPPDDPLEEMDPVLVRLKEKEPLARVVPPGTPVPTKGIAKIDFWMWQHTPFGQDFRPPALGRKEAADWQYKMARVELLVEEIVERSATVQRRVDIANSKGGASKTPVACNMASVLYYAIEGMILLADVNESDSTTCDMMGINPLHTAKLRYAMHNLDDFNTPAKILGEGGLARQNRRGNAVRVLASGIGNIDDFTFDDVVKLLMQLDTLTHSSVYDSGNHNRREANRAAAAVATDLVIPCLYGNKDTFDQAISTLWTFAQQGHLAKVRRAFMMVSMVPPGVKPGNMFDQLNKSVIRLSEYLTDNERGQLPSEHSEKGKDGKNILSLSYFNISKQAERIHLAPFDQYIADKRPAHAESLQIDTLIAYLELWLAIFKQDSPVPSLDKVLEAGKPADTKVV